MRRHDRSDFQMEMENNRSVQFELLLFTSWIPTHDKTVYKSLTCQSFDGLDVHVSGTCSRIAPTAASGRSHVCVIFHRFMDSWIRRLGCVSAKFQLRVEKHESDASSCSAEPARPQEKKKSEALEKKSPSARPCFSFIFAFVCCSYFYVQKCAHVKVATSLFICKIYQTGTYVKK